MTNLEAALFYAGRGWHVLPIQAGDKRPASAHGVKDATTDLDVITKWFEGKPDLNVAIAAGENSGLVVFDIDPRNGGLESWDLFTAQYGQPEDCLYQITAGQGSHYVYRNEDVIRSCKMLEGVDVLSDGRYFVVYPSVINGRQYHWEASSDPFEGVMPGKVPQAWIAAYAKDRAAERANKATLPEGNVIEGSRNNTLFKMACTFRRHGCHENEILGALVEMNKRCVPELSHKELVQISHSASKYQKEFLVEEMEADEELARDTREWIMKVTSDSASVATENSFFPLHSGRKLLDYNPTPDWLIRNYLPGNGTTNFLFGESGVGKSFVALDMALSIATGRAFAGNPTKKAKVVYLCGEGRHGLIGRLQAWAKHYKSNHSDLDNIFVSEYPIAINGQVNTKLIVESIRQNLANEPVGLLIVDTLHNHLEGDENSAKDSGAFLLAVKAIQNELRVSGGSPAVLIVHHEGLSDDGRMRGSTAWKASADTVIRVSKSKKNDAIRISLKKAKDFELPDPITGTLIKVELDRFDESNKFIQSAIFNGASGPVGNDEEEDEDDGEEQPSRSEMNKKKKAFKFMNTWLDAWRISEQWYVTASNERLPKISKADLKASLSGTLSEGMVKKHMSESQKYETVGWSLINNAVFKDGQDFVVKDNDWLICFDVLAMPVGGASAA